MNRIDEVRPMTPHDVGAVVDLHLAAFPGFFLSFLGPRFLRELYGSILDDPSGIAFVSEQKGRLHGFVAGTTSQGGLYSRILGQRWWRFALAAIPSFVRRPAIAPRLWRALTKPVQRPPDGARGTLMSLAVAPARQGGGLGSENVHRFLYAAKERGMREVDLTTDADENEPVQRFYEKLGFRVTRRFVTPEGRNMLEYSIDL